MKQGDLEKLVDDARSLSAERSALTFSYREEADLLVADAADKRAEAERLVPEIEKLNSRLLDARGRKGENVKRKAAEKARVQELKKELQATLVEARSVTSTAQQRHQEYKERRTRLLKKVQARVALADRASQTIPAVEDAFEHHAKHRYRKLESANATYRAESEAAWAAMAWVDALLHRKRELQSMMGWDLADADHLLLAKIAAIKAEIQRLPDT